MDSTIRTDTARSMTLRINHLLSGRVFSAIYMKYIESQRRILLKEAFLRPKVPFCGYNRFTYRMLFLIRLAPCRLCTRILGSAPGCSGYYFGRSRVVRRARWHTTPANGTSSRTIPAISGAIPLGIAPSVTPLLSTSQQGSSNREALSEGVTTFIQGQQHYPQYTPYNSPLLRELCFSGLLRRLFFSPLLLSPRIGSFADHTHNVRVL